MAGMARLLAPLGIGVGTLAAAGMLPDDAEAEDEDVGPDGGRRPSDDDDAGART